MDKYAIMCLFILVILSIWHAIIGGLIFLNVPDARVTPKSWFVELDRSILILSIIIYIIIHIILFLWLYFVPLKLRRKLKQKDFQYRQLISRENQMSRKRSLRQSKYIPVTIEN